MKFLDIGEVALRSGVKPSALRYYEAEGLISSVRRHGLRRQFPPEVLLQLKLIALCKQAGFSLDQIARMFNRQGLPDLPRATLHERADEIDRQILELTALREMLRHAARYDWAQAPPQTKTGGQMAPGRFTLRRAYLPQILA